MTAQNNIQTPTYLSSFPENHPSPPVETNAQQLPVDKLNWKDFERLCYRLAQREGEIERCALYGTPGQSQHGIDIFSRRPKASQYVVYQCKHEENFGPQKIEDAVNTFLGGSWKERTEKFVLCTKEALDSTLRQEKIEALRKKLSELNIDFGVWDLDEISLLLKSHPDLVDDFFGRQWVKVFLGDQVAEALKNRLEGKDFTQIRNNFAKFYALVFKQNDPGIPHWCSPLLEANDVSERYVLPDTIERKESLVASDSSTEMTTQLQAERNERATQYIAPPSSEVAYLRQPVDSWLARHQRCAVLGEPGTGKSSLLRVLTLDLLNSGSRFSQLHKKWGSCLPVWVPFAFWTRQVQSDPGLSSLPAVFRRWLETWDEDADFIDLFQKALDDDRLLILVDGLDEWSDDNAATIALQQLQVFLQKRNLDCIVTCRTHSYSKHTFQLGAWPSSEIASFNKRQQESFCSNWYLRFLRAEAKSQDTATSTDLESRSLKLAGAFLTEASRISSLREFLENPLLLGLLLTQKFLSLSLPANKARAMDVLVGHLLSMHPKAREAAAKVTGSSEVSGDDLIGLLSYVAFEGLVRFPEGAFEKHSIREIIENYLRNEDIGFGWNIEKARSLSTKLISEASEKLGILLEKSPRLLGFYHRSIQEYLAARHIARLNMSQQKEVIDKYISNLEWKPTLVFFFGQIPKESDVRELVTHIETHLLKSPRTREASLVLIANAIFLNSCCPANLIKRLSILIFDEIYLTADLSTRRDLIDAALDGSNTSRSVDIVRNQIPFWYPGRSRWRAGLIGTLRSWKPSEKLLAILWRGLFDEETSNRRTSAQTIAVLYKDDNEVMERLVGLFESNNPPEIRATALEALQGGWPTHPKCAELATQAKTSDHPEIKLLGILGTLLSLQPTQDDLDILIGLSRYPGGVDYHWKGLAVETIAKHWKNDAALKTRCIEAARKEARRGPERDIDRDTAWYLLVRNYPGDNEVEKLIVDELQEEHPFLSVEREIWTVLSSNFPNSKAIIPAFETWARKDNFRVRELSLAAGIAPTENMKQEFISRLDDSVPFWAAEALLEHWNSDPSVHAALKDFVNKNAQNAATVGYLLPQILEDKTDCRTKLLALLKDERTWRLDYVMSGLFRLDGDRVSDDVIEAFFSVPRQLDSLINAAGANLLISNRPDSEKVRNLALAQLEVSSDLLPAIAYGFREDVEIQDRILQMQFPLESDLRLHFIERVSCSDIPAGIQRDVLSKYQLEFSANVKTAASIGHHRIIRESGVQDRTEALKSLTNEAFARGPEHAQERHAAFCGIVELRQAEILKTLQDPHRADKVELFSLPYQTSLDRNVVLTRYIVENWSYLKSTLGERFVPIISGGKNSLEDMWDELADFADQNTEIREELLTFVESTESIGSYSLLDFLNRERPRSEILLKHCLAVLKGDGRQPSWRDSEVDFFAAELVGTHFNERKDVLEEIEKLLLPPYFNDRAILALHVGWPGHDKSKVIYDFLSQRKQGTGYPAFAHLICKHGTSSRVVELLQQAAQRVSGGNRIIMRWALPPVETRFRNDSSIAQIAIDTIKRESDIDMQVTLLQFCKRQGVDLSELSEWAEQQVSRQRVMPRKGRDMFSNQTFWLDDIFKNILTVQ